MTEIRYCVGGPKDRPCTSFGHHGDDCPNRGIPDDQPKPCRGCAPRHATEGHLCATCDTYLRQWLDVTQPLKMHSLLWVHDWLGLSQSLRGSRAPRWDFGRGQSGDRLLPSPLNEAILDCRRLLEDRVYIAEERVREVFDGTPAVGRFDFTESVAFLASRILRIEDDADLCRHVYERFQDSMVTAHQLAPWRPVAERLSGIPCPHCERVSLVIEGGEDFATCRTCRCTVVSKRFDQWVAMLDHERGA